MRATSTQLSMFDGLPSIFDPVEEALRALPKIDLHAHLSGSLRFSTVEELVHSQGLAVPRHALWDLRRAVTFYRPAPSYTASFQPWAQVLNRVTEIPGIIHRLVLEVAQDFADDGVIYTELRVSPRIPLFNGELDDFLALLDDAVSQARQSYGIDVRIILGFARHTFYQLSRQQRDVSVTRILKAADRYRGRTVVGFDLWGNEERHPPKAFQDTFAAIREAGYPLTIHAGEVYSSSSIRDAVELLRCARLGHAAAITKDPSLFALVAAHHVLIEVCLTSNWVARVVNDLSSHPMRSMLAHDIPVTLGTDDTLVFNTTLSRELAKALRLGLIAPADICHLFCNAAAHLFVSEVQRTYFADRITAAYSEEALASIATALSARSAIPFAPCSGLALYA